VEASGRRENIAHPASLSLPGGTEGGKNSKELVNAANYCFGRTFV